MHNIVSTFVQAAREKGQWYFFLSTEKVKLALKVNELQRVPFKQKLRILASKMTPTMGHRVIFSIIDW